MKLKETLVALLALSLTACGTPEIVLVPDPAPFEDYAGSREEDSSPVELPEDMGPEVIGNGLTGSFCLHAGILNRTGSDILTFEIKSSVNQNYSDNLIPAGVSFSDGELKELYYDPLPDFNGARGGSEDLLTWLASLEYTALIITGDGVTHIFRLFPLQFTRQMTLCLDGDTAYVTCILENGKSISTLRNEQEKRYSLDEDQKGPLTLRMVPLPTTEPTPTPAEIAAGTVTPSPTPSPRPTNTPVPTPSPEPSEIPTEIPEPSVSPTPSPAPTVTRVPPTKAPTHTPVPTQQAEPTEEPVPTEEPEAE